MNYELFILLCFLALFISLGIGGVTYGLIYAIRLNSIILIIFNALALLLISMVVFMLLYEIWLKDLIIKTYKWFKEMIKFNSLKIKRLIQEKKDKKVWLEIDEILVELLEEKYLILIIKDYLDIKN